jgi:DNA-binding NtrC family response regulator
MSKRILVVSDDRILGFSRTALLQKAGYQAIRVDSDDEAMSLLETEAFDLVLLGRDPIRRNRKSLDRRLRERHPHLPTLKIEGNALIPSRYATRVTNSDPARVLAVLAEMLGTPANNKQSGPTDPGPH